MESSSFHFYVSNKRSLSIIEYVVISDVHLGHKFSKTELFKTFLEKIRPETKTLCLLGDIFDFWKEEFNPSFLEFFSPFQNILFTPGNHDREILYSSLFTEQVKKSFILTKNNFHIFLTHGDDFDPSFGKDGGIIKQLNLFIYWISCCIGIDLQNSFYFLAERYYNSLKPYFEQRVKENLIDKKSNFLIVGHTHCPGIFEIGDLKVFNLGSWLTKPYAFFVKDNKYAFFEITRDHLLPQEEDYYNLW